VEHSMASVRSLGTGEADLARTRTGAGQHEERADDSDRPGGPLPPGEALSIDERTGNADEERLQLQYSTGDDDADARDADVVQDVPKCDANDRADKQLQQRGAWQIRNAAATRITEKQHETDQPNRCDLANRRERRDGVVGGHASTHAEPIHAVTECAEDAECGAPRVEPAERRIASEQHGEQTT